MFGTARLIVTADILIGSGRQLGGRTGPREPARRRRRGRDDEALPLGRREPLFEAGAGELRARVGQRGALRIGRSVRVAGLAALADLERVTSAGEEHGGCIGETLPLRGGAPRDSALLGLPLPRRGR